MLITTILTTIVSASTHPELGIAADTTAEGVIITAVAAGSPAAPYLKNGDRILSINGEAIDTEAGLAFVLSRTPYGRMFPLVIERNGVASTHPMMRPVPVQWADSPLRQRAYVDRPTTGLGLLIPGAIMLGVGAVMGGLVSVLYGIEDDDAEDLWALAVVSGGLLAAGIPMTIVGGVRHHRYRSWRDEQQEVVRGGAPGFTLSMRF
jgi:PDZ domain-containing protein